MIGDLRNHLDILVVIFVALLVYHFVLKASGVPGGIAAPRRFM